MVFVAWPWIGLKAFFLVANNLFNLILHVPLSRLLNVVSLNRPFPSSRMSPLQSESKCEVFVRVISSTLHMNEN